MVAYVARGSEPTADEAEHGEGEFGGFPPDYDKTIRQRGGDDE
jgi:hypothetical protein